MVKVVNRKKKGRFMDTSTQNLEEVSQGHGGSTFSVAQEASRSLASASILLKLRSRTGLINTLEKTINPFALNEENVEMKYTPVNARFEVFFLVREQGIPRDANHKVFPPRLSKFRHH